MRKILIILILQFIVIEAFASIERIKLHSFDNLVDQIKNDTIKGKDTLIVFDIDGVILCPKDSYLSHNNREVRHKFLDDIEKSQGLAQRKNIYALIAAQMEYKLIEPRLMKHFWFLKFNGYNVIALTSMGPKIHILIRNKIVLICLKIKDYILTIRWAAASNLIVSIYNTEFDVTSYIEFRLMYA
ncbi:MAG: DUF2608 domain-containing protein [Rickettsia sp.]|jgi:hypothetical protein|nr:DUF2608 domain-containing protein [Rickettsia sp.]